MMRVVYVSRNCLPAETSEAEIAAILDAARGRNGRLGVTGALLFTEDAFAQVLEGPEEAVEEVFESIQRDPRHEAVVILDVGPVEAREFGAWSMAYAGRIADAATRYAALVGAEELRPGRVLETLRRLARDYAAAAA